VLVTAEKIPSAAEPEIDAPLYVQVRFHLVGSSVGVVSAAVCPTNAVENVHPLGCVVVVGMIELKS